MNTDDKLRKLKEFGIKNNIPNISEENALYLEKLLQEYRPTHLLEIWSANGYSTVRFALQMKKWSGIITSIDFSQVAYEMAQENFEDFRVTQTVKSYFWDAREIIPLLEEQYDFIFIDGLKKASLEFLKLVWKRALPGCIIIIDDVIKFKSKMEDLYQYVHINGIPHEVLQIDSDDGIMKIIKP